MSKHTPGPWKAVQHGEDWWSVLKGAWDISQNGASEPGVVACAKYSAMTPEENEANARLIAAAPEMLEALRLVRMHGHDGETEDGFSVSYFVDKAIVRVEGKA